MGYGRGSARGRTTATAARGLYFISTIADYGAMDLFFKITMHHISGRRVTARRGRAINCFKTRCAFIMDIRVWSREPLHNPFALRVWCSDKKKIGKRGERKKRKKTEDRTSSGGES